MSATVDVIPIENQDFDDIQLYSSGESTPEAANYPEELHNYFNVNVGFESEQINALFELLEKKPELCINHGPPLYPNPSDIFFYDMNLEKQNNMYRQKRDPYDALRRDGYNWKYIGRYPFGSHRKQLSEAVDEFKNKTKFCRAYYESSKEDARFVVIHYFGDNSNATRTGYLHGNSKNKNKRYIPTAISTLRAIEQIAETESPAKAYDIFKKGMNDAKAPHFLPRDPLQIRNASRKRKKINSSSNVNNNIPYYSNLVDDTVRSSSNVSNSIPYYSYLADDTVRQSLASAVDKDTTIYQLEKDDFNNFCLKDKTGIYALQKKDDNWICSCRMGDDKCIHIIILKKHITNNDRMKHPINFEEYLKSIQ